MDALEDQLAAPALLDPLDVVPVQRAGRTARRSRRDSEPMSLDALDVADDVAEAAPLGAQHAQAPARLGRQVDDVGERRLGRRGQAVLQVLVALAEDLQVEREHQRAALRGLGAVDQALDEVAVAHHVELEPERRLGVRGDVLDRADAHRRQRERDAELLGRARGQDLAVGVLHAGQAGRRDAPPASRTSTPTIVRARCCGSPCSPPRAGAA